MAGGLRPLEVGSWSRAPKDPGGDYWIGGKERWHGLGLLLDVSLEDEDIGETFAKLTFCNAAQIRFGSKADLPAQPSA